LRPLEKTFHGLGIHYRFLKGVNMPRLKEFSDR